MTSLWNTGLQQKIKHEKSMQLMVAHFLNPREGGRPVSQLSPLYPVDAQSQPQEPVVPVAEPAFWQASPFNPTVHASAASFV